MAMPKFKKTKWKINFCIQCKRVVGTRWGSWKCRKEHKKTYIERENIPFKIPDLEVIGHYSWMRAKSEKIGQEFDIAPTEVTTIIMGPGIKPGGLIPDQWWMWKKKGSSLSLTWLGGDIDGDA